MCANIHATRTVASVIGILLGVSMINHGIFETFQGSRPVPGHVIQAIGEAQRFWIHGTEEAYTLLPTFFATGIGAITSGIIVIIWSGWFIQKKHGPTVFLILCILSVFTGGGIGQILFILTSWWFARRISGTISVNKSKTPEIRRERFAGSWKISLPLAAAFFLFALEIAIFGWAPGNPDPDTTLSICWIFLLISWVLVILSYLSAYRFDQRRMAQSTPHE